jgi:protein archease
MVQWRAHDRRRPVPAERREARARLGSTHELVDHTSELTIRLRAPTFPALIEEATRAFGRLVPAALRGRAEQAWRTFQVAGPDRAASLVDWLNELVYLCEVDQWLPVDVEVTGNAGSAVQVRAQGVVLEGPFVLVKAATLHNVSVSPADGGLQAEVTLDV